MPKDRHFMAVFFCTWFLQCILLSCIIKIQDMENITSNIQYIEWRTDMFGIHLKNRELHTGFSIVEESKRQLKQNRKKNRLTVQDVRKNVRLYRNHFESSKKELLEWREELQKYCPNIRTSEDFTYARTISVGIDLINDSILSTFEYLTKAAYETGFHYEFDWDDFRITTEQMLKQGNDMMSIGMYVYDFLKEGMEAFLKWQHITNSVEEVAYFLNQENIGLAKNIMESLSGAISFTKEHQLLIEDSECNRQLASMYIELIPDAFKGHDEAIEDIKSFYMMRCRMGFEKFNSQVESGWQTRNLYGMHTGFDW